MPKPTIKDLQTIIAGQRRENEGLKTDILVLKTDIKRVTEKLHRVDFRHDQLSMKIDNALTAIETIKSVSVPGYFMTAPGNFIDEDRKISAEKTPLYNALFHLGKILFID
jgi:hypothetical protein